MAKSKFRTTPVRSDVNGEHRLQMRLPSGAYVTVAHCADESMARTLVRLLNQRSVEKSAKEARESAQRELLPVEHKGLHPRRLKTYKHGNYVTPPNSEAFYAQLWREWNDGRMSSSTSHVLHYILCPEALQDKGHQTVAYSRRDAQVAATVIQWLGTNVGRGFVLEAEARIKQATELQRQVADVRRRLRPGADPIIGAAERRKDTLTKTRKRLSAAANGAK